MMLIWHILHNREIIVASYEVLVLMFSNDRRANIYTSDLIMANIYFQKYC